MFCPNDVSVRTFDVDAQRTKAANKQRYRKYSRERKDGAAWERLVGGSVPEKKWKRHGELEVSVWLSRIAAVR
jgi:hypothetical protein